MHMIMFLLDIKITNWVPRGLIWSSLFLLVYFNNLPKITDNDAKVVLFADDTSITVNYLYSRCSSNNITKILSDIISWFKANFLSFKFNKTYYLEVRTKSCI